MKKWIPIAICTLLLSACNKDSGWDCTRKMGEIISEQRNPGSFNSVEISGRVDVVYRFAHTPYVSVRYGENVINRIHTELNDSTLSIENTESCEWVRDLSEIPEVTIFGPTLLKIDNRSAGDFTAIDTISGHYILYEDWDGNGKTSLLLNMGEAHIYAHTGFRELNISGMAQAAFLYSHASGPFFASGLISSNTQVNNTSIQDITCYSDGYLFGSTNLSGNIRYRGTPLEIDQELNGTGRVIPF